MTDIWSSLCFAQLTVKNRIARSATNDYMGNEDGTVSAAQVAVYRALAEGGVGLIFTGHCAVQPEGRSDSHQNAIWDDRFIPGLRTLADAAHTDGAKVIAQLSHAGAKAQDAAINGKQPVAPSAVTLPPGKLARMLRADEILHIGDAFADAARRAQRAGFDGVQIHCAHGYLLAEFLDPSVNVRTDAYGGSADNRFRLVGEILRKIKLVTGEDFPVFLKINGNALLDGFTQADLGRALVRARALGAEGAEISGYDFSIRRPDERLYYVEQAVAAQKESGLPVLLVGGIRSLADMHKALDSGVSMVSMSRPFICQPDILHRLRAGEQSRCRGCYGCFSSYQKTGKRCVQQDR